MEGVMPFLAYLQIWSVTCTNRKYSFERGPGLHCKRLLKFQKLKATSAAVIFSHEGGDRL